MRRLHYLFSSFALLLLLPCLARAQTTAITLQVTDAGGQTWNNGTWSATLASPPGAVPAGPPFFQLGSSTPVPNQSQNGTLSATGSATMTLSQNAFISPTNSRWNFLVCGQTTATNNCFNQFVVITAATTVTLTPPALTVNPGPNSLAYIDAEITSPTLGQSYFNVISNVLKVCTLSPCTPNVGWGLSSFVSGSTTVGVSVTAFGAIGDARTDYTQGADCTATNGTSTVSCTNLSCVASDITKSIAGTFAGGTSKLFASAATVTGCSGAAFVTSPAPTTSSPNIVVGTNNDAAWTAAQAAIATTGGNIYVPDATACTPGTSGSPCGYLLQTVLPFNSIGVAGTTPVGLIGQSMDNSVIYVGQNFPYAGNANGAFIRTGGAPLILHEFTIDLMNYSVAANDTELGAVIASVPNSIRNIKIKSWQNQNQNSGGVCFRVNSDDTYIVGLHIKNCADTALDLHTLNTTIVMPDIGNSQQSKFAVNARENSQTIFGGQISNSSGAGTAAINVSTDATGTGDFEVNGTSITEIGGTGVQVVASTTAGTARIIGNFFGLHPGHGTSTNMTSVTVDATSMAFLSNNRLYHNGTGSDWTSTGGVVYDGGANTCTSGTGLPVACVYTNTGNVVGPDSGSITNDCVSSASPAVCASSMGGSVTIAAAATTIVVNDANVTAKSKIDINEDASLGALLGVTCNTQSSLVLGTPRVTARTAGTSFTVSIDVGPTTNPMCLSFAIRNPAF